MNVRWKVSVAPPVKRKIGAKCGRKYANSEVDTRTNARCTLGERGLLKPPVGRKMEVDTRLNGPRGLLKPLWGANCAQNETEDMLTESRIYE